MARGPTGSVLLLASTALVVAAPLVRGGNRPLALIALEWIALVAIVAAIHLHLATATRWPLSVRLLLWSPAGLAVAQLCPLPGSWWAHLPGHELTAQAMALAEIARPGWQAASVDPAATAASLLAVLPVIAAMLAGMLLARNQLHHVARALVAMGFFEVLLALTQVVQGASSPLLFGISSSRPIGTFGNSNHLANFLCMALVLLAWLASERDRDAREGSIFEFTHTAAPWIAGALVLVVGVLASQSRGAELFGLPAAAIAFAIVARRALAQSPAGRLVWPAIAAVVLVAVFMLGADLTSTRIGTAEFANSAAGRNELSALTWHGALTLLPFGSGWGTFESVFPRFQPTDVVGFVNHAHMDYLELFFEGGLLFVAIAGCAGWVIGQRVIELARASRAGRGVSGTEMTSVLAGIGLAAFLLHSLVDFAMRIPANAIAAALLAGMFLRPRKYRTDGTHAESEPGAQ